MVTPNIGKRFSWKYEDTAGTTLLTGDVASWYFGLYNPDVNSWNYPHIINNIVNYQIYNTRNSVLVSDGASMPPFTHTYIPTSGQHLLWQMGKKTGTTSPLSFDAADYDKEQYAISIRGEQTGGTNTALMQLNGCFSTKLFGTIQAGRPYIVEQTWNYMNYDDQDDHDILATAPTVPDTSATPYVGLPTVTYDYKADTIDSVDGDTITLTTYGTSTANDLAGYTVTGITGDNIASTLTISSNTAATPTVCTCSSTPAGDWAADTVTIGYIIPNIIRFDYTSNAIFSQAFTNATETAQVIYKERFEPTEFSITAVFQVNTMWDDYIDRVGTKEIRVQQYKADTSEYIIFDLDNIRISSIQHEGEGYEGYYTATLSGVAEAFSGSYTIQGAHGTHHLGETT